jgi:arylsulfatase A-like enzyme
VAKQNQSGSTVYRDFHVVDQGTQRRIRDAYATDWLAGRAIDFVWTTPPGRPLFLLFAPSAPHAPWIPAERHAGAYADEPVEEPPNVVGALRGAPPWVRSLPFPGAAQRAAWLDARRRSDETLLAVDDAIRGISDALGDRLEHTFIFVLSDHGYSFGEHRWEGKKCPYEACVRIPLAIHAPVADPRAADALLVSTVDLAPTIAGLAGVPSPAETDGIGFASWIDARLGGLLVRPPEAVYLEWAGDDEIPAWTAVRARDLKLIRYADGSDELYDLAGRIGPPDPWETRNRLDDPRYARLLGYLRGLLSRNLGGPG